MFYRDEDGNYAIPAGAFKKAMGHTAKDTNLSGIVGANVNRHIRIIESFSKLEYDKVQRREDVVRQSGRNSAPDIRHRPEFIDWSTVITVRFDADMIPKQSLLNLLARAGQSAGVGDWRPEKGGEHGIFTIGDTNAE